MYVGLCELLLQLSSLIWPSSTFAGAPPSQRQARRRRDIRLAIVDIYWPVLDSVSAHYFMQTPISFKGTISMRRHLMISSANIWNSHLLLVWRSRNWSCKNDSEKDKCGAALVWGPIVRVGRLAPCRKRDQWPIFVVCEMGRPVGQSVSRSAWHSNRPKWLTGHSKRLYIELYASVCVFVVTICSHHRRHRHQHQVEDRFGVSLVVVSGQQHLFSARSGLVHGLYLSLSSSVKWVHQLGAQRVSVGWLVDRLVVSGGEKKEMQINPLLSRYHPLTTTWATTAAMLFTY